jgi:hypothetical protein
MPVFFRPIEYSALAAEVPQPPDPKDLECYACLQSFSEVVPYGHAGNGRTRHSVCKICFDQLPNSKCGVCIKKILKSNLPFAEQFCQLDEKIQAIPLATRTIVAFTATIGSFFILQYLSVTEDGPILSLPGFALFISSAAFACLLQPRD